MQGCHPGRGFGWRFAHGLFGSRGIGRHGRHGGGMHRRRFLDHGDLRHLVLQLVAEKPCHGYEIIKAIEERFGGLYSPSPGAIYPTLTMLEELGHIAATAEDGKRRYALTTAGRDFLAANAGPVQAALERVAEAARAVGAGPAPQIRAAFETLETALRARLAEGALPGEEVARIAAALDAAARSVRHP